VSRSKVNAISATSDIETTLVRSTVGLHCAETKEQAASYRPILLGVCIYLASILRLFCACSGGPHPFTCKAGANVAEQCAML
jgi:hypothetical protein